jgi:hypothetical protein
MTFVLMTLCSVTIGISVKNAKLSLMPFTITLNITALSITIKMCTLAEEFKNVTLSNLTFSITTLSVTVLFVTLIAVTFGVMTLSIMALIITKNVTHTNTTLSRMILKLECYLC